MGFIWTIPIVEDSSQLMHIKVDTNFQMVVYCEPQKQKEMCSLQVEIYDLIRLNLIYYQVIYFDYSFKQNLKQIQILASCEVAWGRRYWCLFCEVIQKTQFLTYHHLCCPWFNEDFTELFWEEGVPLLSNQPPIFIVWYL